MQLKLNHKIDPARTKLQMMIQEVTKNAGFLHHPRLISESYPRALAEVKRREMHNQTVEMIVTRVQNINREERKSRYEFDSKHGINIPKKVMPDLNATLPECLLISSSMRKEMILLPFDQIQKVLVRCSFLSN
jgi:hypothetical protein